jgi:hypothetical protein
MIFEYLFKSSDYDEGNAANINLIAPREATLYLTTSGKSFSKYISI